MECRPHHRLLLVEECRLHHPLQPKNLPMKTRMISESSRQQGQQNHGLQSQKTSMYSSKYRMQANGNHHFHSTYERSNLMQKAAHQLPPLSRNEDVDETENGLLSRRMQYSTRRSTVRSRIKVGPLPNVVENVMPDQPSTCHQIQDIMNQGIRFQSCHIENSTKSDMVLRSNCSIGLFPNSSNQQEQYYRRLSNHSTSNPYSHPNTTDQRQTISRQDEPSPGLIPTSSQPLHNQEKNISKENDSSLKGKRGPRRMDEIWALPEGKFIKIIFNDKSQPVGDNAKKLIGYLGVLARKGMEVPFDYNDWRAVPTDNKDLLWNILMSKFDGIEDYKEWKISRTRRYTILMEPVG